LSRYSRDDSFAGVFLYENAIKIQYKIGPCLSGANIVVLFPKPGKDLTVELI